MRIQSPSKIPFHDRPGTLAGIGYNADAVGFHNWTVRSAYTVPSGYFSEILAQTLIVGPSLVGGIGDIAEAYVVATPAGFLWTRYNGNGGWLDYARAHTGQSGFLPEGSYILIRTRNGSAVTDMDFITQVALCTYRM